MIDGCAFLVFALNTKSYGKSFGYSAIGIVDKLIYVCYNIKYRKNI